MIRSVLGFAVFAVVVILGLKIALGLFGLAIGLIAGILWFALIGFVLYLMLKLVAPDTAARLREIITGKSA